MAFVELNYVRKKSITGATKRTIFNNDWCFQSTSVKIMQVLFFLENMENTTVTIGTYLKKYVNNFEYKRATEFNVASRIEKKNSYTPSSIQQLQDCRLK